MPTFAEQGFPDLTVEERFGFYAPAKTPGNVIDNANAAINAALLDKNVASALGTFGLMARGSTVREMDKSQRDAFYRWGPLGEADRLLRRNPETDGGPPRPP